MDLLIMAKEPIPGRVKSRLTPPCTRTEAAALAEAALADTLEAATACGADRVVLALDGRPGSWLPAGVEVVPQCDGSLDRRLAHAWSQVAGPAVQIGMDTPQLTPADLDAGFDALLAEGVDAVLGPALDGGWWAAGLCLPDPHAFLGVPTSRSDTGALQVARLLERGNRLRLLDVQRDVDTFADALAVARLAPATRFAAAMTSLRTAA